MEEREPFELPVDPHTCELRAERWAQWLAHDPVHIAKDARVLEGLRKSLHIDALWSHEETGNAWSYRCDERVRAYLAARGQAADVRSPSLRYERAA